MAWYDAAWTYRKTIYVPVTTITGNHTDFPLLVVINNDQQLLSYAKSDGSDIFFTDINDTVKYSHERFAYETGSLKAWVKIPNLRSDNQVSSSLRIYYGNDAAPEQQDSASVWDSYYKAVHHLSDISGSTTFKDSTSYNRHYSAGGSTYPTAGSSGKIFNCVSFSGSAWATHSNTSGLPINGDPSRSVAKTISFWARTAALTLTGTYTHNLCVFLGSVICGRNTTSLIYNNYRRDFVWSTNQWDYYVFQDWYPTNPLDTAQAEYRIYKNGAILNSNKTYDWWMWPSYGISGLSSVGLDSYTYGLSGSFTILPWTGSLEEVRISNTSRSAAWITTEYQNQSNPSAFISMSGQDSSGAPPLENQWILPFGNWNYKIPITINSNQVSGSHESIPILVSMSQNQNLATGALQTGKDIIFTDATASQLLPFEILTYKTGSLVAYIRVPWISSAQDTVINMYYGNSSTASLASPTVLWFDYNLVAHLTESVASTTLRNSVNGLTTGTVVSGAYALTGSATYPNQKIIGGFYFPASASGVRPVITFPNASTGEVVWPTTVTMWASADWGNLVHPPTNAWPTLISQANSAASNGWHWHAGLNTTNCDTTYVSSWSWWDGSPAGTSFSGSLPFTKQTWHQFSFVMGESNGTRIYIDGVPFGANRIYGNGPTYYGSGNPIILGNSTGISNADGWSGSMSAVKVGKYAATDARVITDYNNQNNPSAFITVGTQQTASSGYSTASWYNPSSYKYRRKYTINTRSPALLPSGVSLTQLTDFPLLFSTRDRFLDGLVKPDGSDIIFINALDNATKLDYEIVSYATGNVVAWVKMPLIQAHANAPNPTEFYMYFGYPSATNQANSASLWTTDKYAAVWHLGQNSVSGTTIIDSTANKNNLTYYSDQVVTVPTFSFYTGRLSPRPPAVYFDAQYKNLAKLTTSTSLPSGSQPRTVQILSRIDAASDSQTRDMISMGSGSTNDEFGLSYQTMRYGIGRLWGNNGANTGDLYVDFAQGLAGYVTNWNHFAMTYEWPWATYYYNGVRGMGPYARTTLNTVYQGTASLMLGKNVATDTYWSGSLEEARLLNIPRSLPWIYTEYINQNQQFRFYRQSPLEINLGFAITSWYDTDWKVKRKLTVSSTSVSGSHIDFPYLVALNNDTDLLANAKSDGTDIFFTDVNDEAKYAHELLSYSAGTLRAWVRLPSLDSVNGATFNMYYGNPNATPQATASAVWTEDYVGVWHLNDNSGTIFSDSTAYNRHMYVSGANLPTSRSAGFIDKSVTFASAPYSALSASWIENIPYLNQQRYVSCWANPSTIGAGQTPADNYSVMFAVGTNSAGATVYKNFSMLRNAAAFLARGNTAEYSDYGNVANMLTASVWNYYAAAWDGNTMAALYRNGARVAGPSGPPNSAWNNLTNTHCYIGRETGVNVAAEGWVGSIEDVRYSYATRSLDWFWTEYQNQKYAGTSTSGFVPGEIASIKPMLQNVSKIRGIKEISFI